MDTRRRSLNVPTLAMVDAFVGGVAVVLILTVLSSLSDASTATVPRPDRIVTCTGDQGVRVTLPAGAGDTAPVDTNFGAVAETLASSAPPGALSMRILIRTPVAGARPCIAYMTRALNAANDATDAGTLGYAAPVFLIDTEFVEPAPDQGPSR